MPCLKQRKTIMGKNSALTIGIRVRSLLCNIPNTRDSGRNPLNQNFRAEVRKFLGVKWIATGPKRSHSIPLAKRVSH